MKKNLWKIILAGAFTLSQIIVPQFTILRDTELFENKINIVHASVVDSGNCGTEEHESELTWSLDSDGVLRVSGYGSMNDYSGFNVCPWENHKDQIKKIIIDYGITNIGGHAFEKCEKLSSVSIPNTITNIGDCTFRDCTDLTSVVIPDSVTVIGKAAFYCCSSLSSVTILGDDINIGLWTFDKTPWIEEKQKENPLVIVNNTLILGVTCSGDVIIPDNVTRICDYAFLQANLLNSVIIPESVKNIGEFAFCDCKRLKSVIISEGITNIKEYTFGYCDSLLSVTLPDSLTNIDPYAFSSCDELVSVTIPGNVSNIGDGAFNDCWNLASVFFESSKPAELGSAVFGKPSDKLTIYVPADKIENYKNATEWDYYADIISASPSSASPSDNETLTYKMGDFDGDGKVDITDLSALSLYRLGDREFTEAQIKAADVTGDGNTDLADLAHFKQFLSKKTDKFDAE